MSLRFALAPGKPTGIEPDLCLLLTRSAQHHPLIVIASRTLLQERAGQLGLAIDLKNVSPAAWPERPVEAGQLYVRDTSLAAPVRPGQLDRADTAYVLETLTRADQDCLNGHFTGVITAPVHKSVINKANIPFSGHTEFLVDLAHTAQVVMMLATHGLRVALATTRLPLREIADAINDERLSRIARIPHADLRDKFGIAHPYILVCGFSPHADESDHLGRKEIEVIEPCLECLRGEGLDPIDPLSTDTLFTPKHLEHRDAVLTTYHDQGLPVLKYKDSDATTNVILGPPIIRTSVGHGVALDLAEGGCIGSGSLQVALETACQMVASRC